MYQLRLKPGIKQAVDRLPERIKDEIIEIIQDLRDEPRPDDSLEMRDQYLGFHRIRVDGYRIIYKIYESEKLVVIWAVKRRTRTTYNSLF